MVPNLRIQLRRAGPTRKLEHLIPLRRNRLACVLRLVLVRADAEDDVGPDAELTGTLGGLGLFRGRPQRAPSNEKRPCRDGQRGVGSSRC